MKPEANPDNRNQNCTHISKGASKVSKKQMLNRQIKLPYNIQSHGIDVDRVKRANEGGGKHIEVEKNN